MPTAAIRTVTKTLRWAEIELQKAAGNETGRFELPWSLRGRDRTDIRIIIDDGQRIYVRIAQPGRGPTVLGPRDLTGSTSTTSPASNGRPEHGERKRQIISRTLKGSQYWTIELGLEKLAGELPLPDTHTVQS